MTYCFSQWVNVEKNQIISIKKAPVGTLGLRFKSYQLSMLNPCCVPIQQGASL